jgi:hypothetical protein
LVIYGLNSREEPLNYLDIKAWVEWVMYSYIH